MLAIFKNGLVNPPKELNSPASSSQAASLMLAKVPEETLKDFLTSHSNKGFSLGFANTALLAYTPPPHRSLDPAQLRYVHSSQSLLLIILLF